MLISFLTTSIIVDLVLASHHFEKPITAANCSAIHIITARASTEPAGEGVIGSLATLIQNGNQGVTREAVCYPATLSNYASSSSKGTSAMTDQLSTYVSTCPDSKIVLLGYSQGAQVVGDTMCGGGGAPGLGSETPPVNGSLTDKGGYHRPVSLVLERIANLCHSGCDDSDGRSTGDHWPTSRRRKCH